MKYMHLREIEKLNDTLNFRTIDCRVEGSCEVYTTKNTSSDRKLIKDIDRTLREQHENVLRIAATLDQPERYGLDVTGSSPFGTLAAIRPRRTFAYLIAILNATHPDYDFSSVIRPDDFIREKNVRKVTAHIDELIYNLQPKHVSLMWSGRSGDSTPQTPNGSKVWSPRAWQHLDEVMALRDCEIYTFAPQDNPLEEDEKPLWSFNYFFYNHRRKRVCYFYVRAFNPVGDDMEMDDDDDGDEIERHLRKKLRELAN